MVFEGEESGAVSSLFSILRFSGRSKPLMCICDGLDTVCRKDGEIVVVTLLTALPACQVNGGAVGSRPLVGI